MPRCRVCGRSHDSLKFGLPRGVNGTPQMCEACWSNLVSDFAVIAAPIDPRAAADWWLSYHDRFGLLVVAMFYLQAFSAYQEDETWEPHVLEWGDDLICVDACLRAGAKIAAASEQCKRDHALQLVREKTARMLFQYGVGRRQ